MRSRLGGRGRSIPEASNRQSSFAFSDSASDAFGRSGSDLASSASLASRMCCGMCIKCSKGTFSFAANLTAVSGEICSGLKPYHSLLNHDMISLLFDLRIINRTKESNAEV